MEEKSIYNMIMSIIAVIILIPFMVLGMIIQKDMVVWISISFPILMASYLIKSIAYGKDTYISRDILSRIGDGLLDGGIVLLLISFLLKINQPIKWIILAIIILIGVLEIIIDSIQKGLEIKYLLAGIQASILIFMIIYITNNLMLLYLSSISIIIFYMSHLLGKLLENKIILSFDLISIILFGIFLLLI